MHAGDAGDIGGAARDDFVHQISVAFKTIVLQDGGVFRRDLDRLVEILKREGLGMVIAIFSLGNVLGDRFVRQVAIDAAGGGVMRGFAPRVILAVHDVAIGAGFGIGGEIGEPAGIAEGEEANAQGGSQGDSPQGHQTASVEKAHSAWIYRPSPDAAMGLWSNIGNRRRIIPFIGFTYYVCRSKMPP